jgi:hypothetical protein
MRDRNDRGSRKKTKGQCGQSRKHVLSVRLPRDFVEMLERAGRQYVLSGEKPLSAGQVARLLLEQEMERDTAHLNQNIAEIIRRMEAAPAREGNNSERGGLRWQTVGILEVRRRKGDADVR